MGMMGGEPCWANRRPRLFTGPAAAGPAIDITLRCTGEDAYTPKNTTIHTKQVASSFIPESIYCQLLLPTATDPPRAGRLSITLSSHMKGLLPRPGPHGAHQAQRLLTVVLAFL